MKKIKQGEEKLEVSRRKRRQMTMDHTTDDESDEFMSEY